MTTKRLTCTKMISYEDNGIRMGDCREDKIINKIPNKFKKATCGRVHANNQRTFKRPHLDQKPKCGDMDFLSCSLMEFF
jgi:hypothetical protein